jgi:hypothetical protein
MVKHHLRKLWQSGWQTQIQKYGQRLGFCVINAKINGPAYYGEHRCNIASYVFDDGLLNQAKTQYGLNAIESLIKEIVKEDPAIKLRNLLQKLTN